MIKASIAVLLLFSPLTYGSHSQISTVENTELNHQCELVKQGGSFETLFCEWPTIVTCYADIKYADGEMERIIDNRCWSSFSDCGAGGLGAFNPCDGEQH